MPSKIPILALCFSSSFACMGMVCHPVMADDRTMVAAATANAVDALRDDVTSARIDTRVTVGDFLKDTNGNEELLKTLERAEQVGGPRFSSDGGACQIQLQIAGDRVARELISIAALHPNKSPIPADVMGQMLMNWHSRDFTGIGSSISGAKIEFVRPPRTPDDAWGDVSDAARKQAVDAARDDAVHKAINSIRRIPLAAGRTIGDELDVAPFSNAISSWLASRPVRRVRFQADHEVELTLSTPPAEYCEEVLAAAKDAELPLPDPASQAALQEKFARLPAVFSGLAAASRGAPTTAIFAVVLPAQPPAWTEQPLIAEGVADARGSKLKTARLAESAAVTALRTTIEALPLTSNMSIGDAQKKSTTIAQAVDRCLERARPYKVDYRPDGSVSVKSSLNPRELWTEIAQEQ